MRRRHIARFVDEDGDRCLQRMRQIADLHARPFDHTVIGVDQFVDLAGQRRNFARKHAIKLTCLAGADPAQRLAGMIERPQANQNGDGIDHQTADAEQRQRQIEIAGEGGDFRFQHLPVAGHAEPRGASLAVKLDFGFNHFERIVLAIAGGIAALIALIERQLRHRRDGNRRLAKRDRGQPWSFKVAQWLHQPDPAAAGLLKHQIAQLQIAGQMAIGVNGDGIDDTVEMGAQQVAKGALAAGAIELGNHDGDDDERNHRPHRRKQQDARCERPAFHPALPAFSASGGTIRYPRPRTVSISSTPIFLRSLPTKTSIVLESLSKS